MEDRTYRCFMWALYLMAATSPMWGVAASVLLPVTADSSASGRQLLAAPPAGRSELYGPWLRAYMHEAAEALLQTIVVNGETKNGNACGVFLAAGKGFGRNFTGGFGLLAGAGFSDASNPYQAGPYPGVGTAFVIVPYNTRSVVGTLLGLCADESRGAACADVPVKVVVFHVPDPTPFLDTRVAPKATGAPTPLHPAIISGLVWLDIDSRKPGMYSRTQWDDVLPCDPPGGCRASLAVPLTRPVPAGAVYACVRSGLGAPVPLTAEVLEEAARGSFGYTYQPLPSVNTTWWTDGRFGETLELVPPEYSPPYGAVLCETAYPGAYAVVDYTPTPLPASSQGLDVNKVRDGTRRSYQYTLDADHDAMAANTTVPWWSLVADFTTLGVANATGLLSHHINVTDIRKGSVVVSFDVWVPKAFTATQASKVDAAVLAPSAGSFLTTFLMGFDAPIRSTRVVAREVVLPNIDIRFNITTNNSRTQAPVTKPVVYGAPYQGNVGAIVAGVISAVVSLIIFVVALTVWLVRRRKLRRAVQPVDGMHPVHPSYHPEAHMQPRTPSHLPAHDMRAGINPYPSSSAWAAAPAPHGHAMAGHWAVPHPA